MGPPIKSNRTKRSCFKKERVGGQKKMCWYIQTSWVMTQKICLEIVLMCISFKAIFQRLDFLLKNGNRHDVIFSPLLTALPDGRTQYQGLMRSSDSICILNLSDLHYALFVNYNNCITVLTIKWSLLISIYSIAVYIVNVWHLECVFLLINIQCHLAGWCLWLPKGVQCSPFWLPDAGNHTMSQ